MGDLKILSKNQLKDRLRFLSDKIQSIYDSIEPKLLEFSELKKEYTAILVELKDRGLLGEVDKK